MLSRSLTRGETLIVRYTPTLEGVEVEVDETWSAAVRVTTERIGGPTALDASVAIVDGKFEATINTSTLAAGTYYYDVRITPPGSTPRWHGATTLTLAARNSPPS